MAPVVFKGNIGTMSYGADTAGTPRVNYNLVGVLPEPGDTIFMVIFSGTSVVDPGFSVPGWTELRKWQQISGNKGTATVGVYYRVRLPTDGLTYTYPGPVGMGHSVRMYWFSGAKIVRSSSWAGRAELGAGGTPYSAKAPNTLTAPGDTIIVFSAERTTTPTDANLITTSPATTRLVNPDSPTSIAFMFASRPALSTASGVTTVTYPNDHLENQLAGHIILGSEIAPGEAPPMPIPLGDNIVASGRVNGRFIVSVIDGADADENPDYLPVKGKITFKASIDYVPIKSAYGAPVTMLKTPIVGVIDDEGYLCTPWPGTEQPMYRGVTLIATDDVDLGVTGWTWGVTYQLKNQSNIPVSVNSHHFELPGGSSQDLTLMVPSPVGKGYGPERAEAWAQQSKEEATRAANAAERVVSLEARMDSGEFKGAKGDRGDSPLWVVVNTYADAPTVLPPGSVVFSRTGL